jgi:hypothetical protein
VFIDDGEGLRFAMHPVPTSADVLAILDRIVRRIARRLAAAARVRSRSGLRKVDREDATSARNVAYTQCSAIRFYGAAADREPKTESRPVGAPLFERVKQLLDLSVRKAAALVLNFQEDPTCARARRERHVAFGPRELECILDQVGKRRSEHVPICIEGQTLLDRRNRE